MSHTATVKAVRITNINALRAALVELNAQGIRCSLAENVKPRAFYENQDGMGVAPYVILLPDAKYDIGLYPSEGGGYEARTDFWKGSLGGHSGKPVEDLLGARCSKAGNEEQAKLGKLFQAYGIHATIDEARKKGLSVRRISDADTGRVKLVLSGANL